MRLAVKLIQVDPDGAIRITKDRWLGMGSKGEKHRYAVQLFIDDETGRPNGGLVVDLETDKDWTLVEVSRLRQ